VIIEPTELFNILNQETIYPCVSDPNYLLLIDARVDSEYDESHIITAKRSKRDDLLQYFIPYDAELECKTHIVVYDGSCKSKRETCPALTWANLAYENGSKNPVKVLRGGYENFSALYPFLRTQKILFMPRELDAFETYPCEIIPQMVFLGTTKHALNERIRRELKIEANLIFTRDQSLMENMKYDFVLCVNILDNNEGDFTSEIEKIMKFMDTNRDKSRSVLITSSKGISSSATASILYVMTYYKYNLKEAWRHVKMCKHNIRPNRHFVAQLSDYEQQLMSEKITDIADPLY